VTDSFLERLAQPRPDPGGAAAAAYACTVGLALVEKIVRLEIRREGNQGDFWPRRAGEVQLLSERIHHLREEDSLAYLRLARTRNSGATYRDREIAIAQAVACPSDMIETARGGLDCVFLVGRHCKVHLVPDLQVACELMGAAGMGAYHIAAANLRLLRDASLLTLRQSQLSAILEAFLKQYQAAKHELALITESVSRG